MPPGDADDDAKPPYPALEQAYRNQRAIIHAIGVSSPDFTYLFDRNHRFVYVSPPLLKLWGRTENEALGKNFEELGYSPELVELHKRQLDEALTGKTVSGSNSYVSPSGVEGFYEYTFVPVVDDNGEVTTVVGTTRDVTARVLADRERAEVLEALRESEAQFRHFADAMPHLAWIAQADGYITWYNQRWHEYAGTTSEQMEGWGWQSVHHPEELPRVLQRWKESIATGQPFEMSFPLRGADGTFRWFLTRSTPVRDRNGRLVRWFGTNTDIDAQKRALEERDEAVRFRDEFLSIASHELKTPLASLLLTIEALQRLAAKHSLPEGYRQRLERARAAGRRLDRLIVELLDVSRVALGTLRLEPEPLDLAQLVAEVRERYEQRGRPLRVTSETIVGRWDPLRLDQVLTNLIDNAIKYGGGQPIDVVLKREGEHAVLRVIDRGIGIAPENIGRVFDRFTRLVPAREYGGFGIGLWIVRQIVEASGGRIDVASAAGKGSTFTVTLPIALEE